MGYRITDEEYRQLKRLSDDSQSLDIKVRAVDAIVTRLESERQQEDRDIIGKLQKEYFAMPVTASAALYNAKEAISTFLNGRIKHWEDYKGSWNSFLINEIKHIHEAVCGEVGDE